MAGDRFDSLSRALAGTTSRRQMLRIALSATLGSLLARAGSGALQAAPAAAATCPPNTNPCPVVPGIQATAAPCCPAGGVCGFLGPEQAICCVPPARTGLVEGIGACECSGTTPNSGIVCQTGSNVYTCCPTNARCTSSGGVGSCACNDGFTPATLNGQLVACCPPGQHPDDGQCLCDATHLPPINGKCERCSAANCTGCCTDKGCQDGILPSACGAGGAICAVCPAHAHCTTVNSVTDFHCICEGTNLPPVGGVCPDHCGPDTCSGCCYNGRLCDAGTDNGSCGAGGQHCEVCPANGEAQCTNGQCLCLSNNQPPCGPNKQCCPAGGTCQSGACICTATGQPPVRGLTGFPTCPDCGPCSNGCCLADTGILPNPPQQCISYLGQSAALCGANGAVCVPCPGQQLCRQGVCVCPKSGQPPVNGLCESCDLRNCPTGCCDANLNCILPADQSSAQCGTFGLACVACPSGTVCQDLISEQFGHPNLGRQCVCSTSGLPPFNGVCPPCNASTCPHGCCDTHGVCQPGTSNSACGSGGGGTCADCTAASATCQSGQCLCTNGQPPVVGGQCACPPSSATCPGGTTSCGLVAGCRAVCCPSNGTCSAQELGGHGACQCNTTDAFGNQGALAACNTNNNQPNAPFIYACCGASTVCAVNADATNLGLIGRSVCCPVGQTCCSYGPLDVSKKQAACLTVGTGPQSVAPACCAPGHTCCPGTGSNNPTTCCPPGSSCTGPGVCSSNKTGTCSGSCTTDADCTNPNVPCQCIGGGCGEPI